MEAFSNFFVSSRGSKAKLMVLLSLFVLAASVMEEPLSTLKDGKAAIEDQVKEHLPTTSGSNKEESLLQRAERAIKETLSSAKGKLDEGKESVKSGMQDTLSSAKGKLNEGQESVKSGVGSVTGGGEADDNSDSLFSTVKKTIMGDKSSDESGSSEEKNEEGWFSRNVKEPLQGTMETVKHPARDTAAVDEGNDETMYDNLKKRVTGLFSYKEDNDDSSVPIPGEETLSDVKDRVAH